MSGEEDESSSSAGKKRNWSNRGKLWHGGRCYNYGSCSLTSLYYRCASGGCLGRANKTIATGEITVSKEHICEAKGVREQEHEKIRKAAFVRLRELTSEAEEGVTKASDIVRRLIGELAPENRAALPTKVKLRRRVTDFARKIGVQLAKSTYVDLQDDEGEGEVGVGVDVNHPPPEALAQSDFVKKEPIDDHEDEDDADDDPSGASGGEETETNGVTFLKEKCSRGKPKVRIGDQIFVWAMDSNRGDRYKCQEVRIGCRVSVRIFREGEGKRQQRPYEIRGTHVHKRRMLSSQRKRTRGNDSTLNLVDEDGRDLGAVPLAYILTAGGDPAAFTLDYDNLPRVTTSTPGSTTGTLRDCGGTAYVSEGPVGDSVYSNDMDDVDEDDDDENDFPVEFGGDDLEPDLEDTDTPGDLLMTKSGNAPPSELAAKDKFSRKRSKGMRSGEKCFVCGDDLILSEAMSSTQETFRKACCYLNVKTERDWFPQSSNGQINYFCESCTSEIRRIQKLYERVEEMQSLIFQKVEHVEKRIADAVIVDNWQDEAPPISAIRLEGFRKQVLINYRNKLKLRREIRVGRKMGHVFKEVQPNTSANMFASDPADTDAFQRVASSASAKPVSVKRGRGRPKSKGPQDSVEIQSQLPPGSPFIDQNPASSNPDICDAGDFHGDFDDSVSSVSSEREAKFWEGNPSQLQIDSGKYDIQNDGGDSDVSDPLGDKDDDDWEPSTSATRRSKRLRPTPLAKGRGRPSKEAGAVSHTTSNPSDTEDINSGKPKPAAAHNEVKPPQRKSHSGSVVFPDAVLRRDGRIFMSGIEIIKNPPGTYVRRPDSPSFTCGACHKIVRGFWHIRSHICGTHLGMFNCTSCEKQFTLGKALAYHVKRNHSETSVAIPCPICERPIIAKMQYHRWSHLSEEEKKDPQYQSFCPPHKRDPNRVKNNFGLQTYMCSYCSKTFFNTRALKAHELSHTGDAPSFQCQYCGKVYNNRKGIHKHTQTCSKKALGIQSVTRYPCSKCPVDFKSHQARQQHMKRLHGNLATSSRAKLRYSCPSCTRSFNTQRGFKSHKLVCSGRSIRDGSPPQPSSSSAAHHDQSMSPDSSSGSNHGHPSSSGNLPGFAYNMFGSYPGGNIYHP